MSTRRHPCAELRAEHQVILRVLDVLETLIDRNGAQGVLETGPLERCVEFFRLYADACHHAKEEDLLFPVLEARGVPRDGGPIGVMLYEHRVARSLVSRMGEALATTDGSPKAAATSFREAAREYLELLRQHIFKEDHVLFETGEQLMTDDDRTALEESFCDVGCRRFDGRRREELEAMAADLERTWSEA